MIIKSYKNNNVELLVTENESGLYSVLRLVSNSTSEVHTGMDFESAMDTFDYWLDMELENDK